MSGEQSDKCNTCLPYGTPEAPTFDYLNTPGAKAAREAGLVNLADLAAGEKGTVERVSETDHDLGHLVREGHNPAFIAGLKVTVLAKSPNNGPVLIRAEDKVYDICNDVASVIWVKKVVE